MKTTQFDLTMRSLTTFKTDDSMITVHEGQDPQEVAKRIAAGYGSEVVSLAPSNPEQLLRETLKELLGFVEAWHFTWQTQMP